jgi:hypothetical protein
MEALVVSKSWMTNKNNIEPAQYLVCSSIQDDNTDEIKRYSLTGYTQAWRPYYIRSHALTAEHGHGTYTSTQFYIKTFI